jgi:hypothetical protein
LRLKAFLLRHDIRSTGWGTWGPTHLRWLREAVLSYPGAADRLPGVCPDGDRAH